MENALFNKLIKQEKQLIAKSGSLDALEQLIDDEFVEVGSLNGFIDKQEVLRWLASPDTSNRVSFQFKTKRLAEDVILITYMTNIQNKDSLEVKMDIRTSIWRSSNDEWKLVFHQATPLQ